jgi:AraC-like DNA-binding protein
MPGEPELYRVATERVPLPPMPFADTFHWDGVGPMSQDGGPAASVKPTRPSMHGALALTQAPFETQRQMATGWHARPSLPRSDLGPVRSAALQAIDWAREAESFTVSVDQGLLLAAAHDAIPGATGELVWICRQGQAQCITLYAHPVLLVHGAAELLQTERVEIVPHLRPSDPLVHHMTLVLQAVIDAEDGPGRLYAEALTHALAVHLLRRSAACRLPAGASSSGLSKPKLRRTTAYIEAHLAQELSVTELAAVAQTSPAYFARLFRQATGQAPHQYIIKCRIEHAKRLLRETEWPIIDIGHHVGFPDQSYFTAVFRKHVTMTPKAYRGDTQQ